MSIPYLFRENCIRKWFQGIFRIHMYREDAGIVEVLHIHTCIHEMLWTMWQVDRLLCNCPQFFSKISYTSNDNDRSYKKSSTQNSLYYVHYHFVDHRNSWILEVWKKHSGTMVIVQNSDHSAVLHHIAVKYEIFFQKSIILSE